MKFERVKNAKRNIVFGFLQKFSAIILLFIIRTIIIRYIGAEYLGIDSLYTSIFQVLNLVEMGFGNAIVYSLYIPIAENDVDTICSILHFYKKVYFVIGLTVFILGLLIMPGLSYMINGMPPQGINIYYVYVIYLINVLVSYCILGYRKVLLIAYQRQDVLSIADILVKVVSYIAQIVVLVFTSNYYLYSIILIFSTVGVNISTAIISKKAFPDIICRGQLDVEIRKDVLVRIKGLIINKLCATSRNAFDSIFVTAFLGLLQTAIYNNYLYIMNAVITFLSVISSSIIAGVGNSVAVESKEKNYNDMLKFNFLYMWLSGWCTICLLCLYQPFTEVFFGKDMLFPMGIVCLFCIYFYVLKMGDIRSVYVEANGLWWENRYRAVVEASGNILLNYVLGKTFGIYGIIMATLVSLFCFNFLWGSNIIFKHYFARERAKEYFVLHIIYALTTLMCCIFSCGICYLMKTDNSLWNLFINMIICLIVPNLLYLICYRNMKVYKMSIEWVKRTIKIFIGGKYDN